MKLYVSNVILVADTSVVSDPEPQTAQERIAFVQDAISEVNSWMASRRTGIRLEAAFVEDGDIRVESGD